ncbi:hypothetical protein GJ744_007065 [Endocarpon pusillum]|uniref:Uncharacterized protein n=1 Tax=Endocarpon pusillum TaxID=364733 RepID=A0A8H7AN71_9EURO|nr:hypothetical protein GJ744_007065 [Endocarpon pusillum]
MSTIQAGVPVRIYESSRRTLDPLLADIVLSGYRVVSASSESTVNEDSPKAFIEEDHDVPIKLGLTNLPKPPNIPFGLQQRVP